VTFSFKRNLLCLLGLGSCSGIERAMLLGWRLIAAVAAVAAVVADVDRTGALEKDFVGFEPYL
jgi:hypothetical protein